jgi:RNA polymerase sigma-70 factor (ECF subfamily)
MAGADRSGARGRETPLQDPSERRRFDNAVLPHLDAAFNLARWLTRDDHDAEDVVQEAYCRALRYFPSFRGGDGRTWLLQVVRHTCYTWLRQHRARELTVPFDETVHSDVSASVSPEQLCLRHADQQLLRQALEVLPVEFREVIVLRELEGLSYKEMATVAGIPLGTVMSRLARARQQLQEYLADCLGKE